MMKGVHRPNLGCACRAAEHPGQCGAQAHADKAPVSVFQLGHASARSLSLRLRYISGHIQRAYPGLTVAVPAGRLNILANVVRKPMQQIFAEFGGALPSNTTAEYAGTGETAAPLVYRVVNCCGLTRSGLLLQSLRGQVLWTVELVCPTLASLSTASSAPAGEPNLVYPFRACIKALQAPCT